MSGLVNKVKDALSGDKTASGNTTTGAHSGVGGTHGATTTSTGASTHPVGGGTHAGTTTAGSTNAGPHSSNLANTADPRVDSDLGKGHFSYHKNTRLRSFSLAPTPQESFLNGYFCFSSLDPSIG